LNAFDERPAVYVFHVPPDVESAADQFTLINEARVEIADAGWYVITNWKFFVCPIGIWNVPLPEAVKLSDPRYETIPEPAAAQAVVASTQN
jgi:hypothetical protein